MTGLVEGDDPYVYPDTTVLQNKRHLTMQDELDQFERSAVAWRVIQAPLDVAITPTGYREIHRYLFQDVYEWAGKDRTVEIWGRDTFAFSRNIESEIHKRFKQINAEHNLAGLNAHQFSERAGEHICEINAIHPFRDGNGRTQRYFLKILAHQAGHHLAIDRMDPDLWMKGSIEGFRHQDYSAMNSCIYAAMMEREP